MKSGVVAKFLGRLFFATIRLGFAMISTCRFYESRLLSWLLSRLENWLLSRLLDGLLDRLLDWLLGE